MTARDWLLINEQFTAPQGEGPYMGRPAFWLRLGGCNLACRWCDTPDTWVFDERHVAAHDAHIKYDPRHTLHRATISSLVKQFVNHPLRRYAITGGEPLLQLEGVSQLISGVNELTYDPFFEIETAGTIAPGELAEYENVWFNVSPKLASSGNPLAKRRIAPALSAFNDGSSCFKFVVDTRDPDQWRLDIEEVYEIIDEVGIPHGRVWLMPCGVTESEVIFGMRQLEEVVVKNGWNLSSRLHVLMHGSERGH
ncbi:MAG TPA: 7-carboxy-7-deazaguanine synthase QueE [Nitrospira sp.]|nr:7-carboxy-7-deazaguanine synthase QueE [Nitrospira sp.]